MIVISTPTFDFDGFVVIDEDAATDTNTRSRRVSRTATLDGGVVLTDSGYSDGDRTFNIVVANPTETLYNSVAYLQENYPLIVVSAPGGMFAGAIQRLNTSNGSMRVSILVDAKITE